jgi:ABC-2 type transport system ATP-binding protein
MTDPLRLEGAGVRFGRVWALRDRSLALPAGSVTALVGPNGAGKTTLLHLAAGLLHPTIGTVSVYGHAPWGEPAAVLPRIGFVAQEHPLYRGFTVAEMLRVGRALNPRWDGDLAASRLARLGIPLGKRVGALSGGQQAQVALVMALAKRPDLLLLDEPLASLDPLARREFVGLLAESVAETGVTVLLSSHIITELERICDRLVLLVGGATQLDGAIDDIVAAHQRLIGPPEALEALEALAHHHTVIESQRTQRQATVLARLSGPLFDPAWQAQPVALEDIVLAYLARAAGRDAPEHPKASEVAKERAEVAQ